MNRTPKAPKSYNVNGKQVNIIQTSGYYRNCLAEASYAVSCEVPLNDNDFNVLRSAEAFMYGQETGIIRNYYVKDGLHVYTAHSLCDSSD